MKTCVEFGVRGGAHSMMVVQNVKQGQQLACELVWVLSQGQESHASTSKYWYVDKGQPRLYWTSETHFVALSILDGKDRGPATPALWKLPEQAQ